MPGLSLVKKTKILIPKRRPEFLRRQRLVDFVHTHTDRRLFLVSAPAGYGKTTLLVDFAADTELPICWYTLDSSAQEPRAFVEHFIAAIQHRFPHFGEHAVELLDSVTEFTADGLTPVLTSLVNEILDEIPEYFAIVLDDFHLVEQSEHVSGFVTQFLEDAPENCCLIVAGRTVPGQLPIVSMASRQQVAGLGSNDLRFTAEETVDLLKQMYGAELAPQEVRALVQEAEGWITGIMLSTHDLWQNIGRPMPLARGTVTVYDYLASEVFERQDAQLRDFLLDTSILEELSPPLCNAVLGINNASAILSALEERNLFLSRLEGEGQWYRYHRLFQGYLVSRLQREHPTRFTALHHQASGYFKSTGDLHQAISHLLIAADYPEAAVLMEKVAVPTFVSGQHLLMIHWHEALPSAVAEQHPWLIVELGKAYAEQGHQETALELLNVAERIFGAAGNATGTARTLVQKATVLRLAGRYAEAAQLCSQAASLTSRVDGATAAEIQRTWGICLGQLGSLADAVARLEEALERYQAMNKEFNVAQVRSDLGAYLERMGHLEAALTHFEQAVETFRYFRNFSELANALNSQGVIYYYRGEYDRARETLHEALRVAHQAGSDRWIGYVLTGLGDIERDSSRPLEALDHYHKALSLLDEKRDGFLSVYIRAAEAGVYATQGDVLRARDLARRALELAIAHQSSYEEALANTARGLAAMDESPAEAVEALEQAVEQFKQNGATRDLSRAAFLSAAALDASGAREKAFERFFQALAAADRLRYRHALRALSAWAGPLLAAAITAGFDVSDLLTEPAPARIAGEVTQTSMPHVVSVRLRGLGTSRVEVDGNAALGKWNKARELIFLLATQNRGEGMQREEIYEALWTEVPAAKAYGNLHSLLYRVRKALPNDSLPYEDNLYRFASPGGWTYDLAEFQEAIAGAEAAHGDQTIDKYAEAVALYQGDFLKDLYAEWSIELQRTLRDLFLLAISKVAYHYWEVGKAEAAVQLTHRWLQEEPADESAHRLLMRYFAAQGNMSGLKRQYQLCEEALRKELDVEPSEETRELYAELAGAG